MIKDFIKNVLKISSYRLIEHKTGKDNKTYEVIIDHQEKIIVQELSSIKNCKNKDFIERVISYNNHFNSELLFADTYYKDRFYDYKGLQFQVMQKLAGSSIDEQDISSSLIEESGKKLAYFHKFISSFESDGFSEVNYFKKTYDYQNIAEKYVSKDGGMEINNVFIKLQNIYSKIKIDDSLPRGVIHGDPSFKNFLIDKDKNIIGLIDYDMMSVSTKLWDLADLIRSYLKLDFFEKKHLKGLVDSYNKIYLLENIEKENLINYCKLSVVDTGFRYIISYFKNTNLIGGQEDCLEKANRCCNEIEKLNKFSL